ncbi:MAG TPA: hypothetical protein DDW91_08045, partial [Shewanella frigidimarina]|nr:hypothetical protein [Shewanella frigidimarina]
IIVMTDGISAQQFNQASSALNSRYRLSIMAFGSKQGAPIRLADGQLLRDSSNEVVVAKTDYGLLQKLTQQHQGILVPAQTDGSDVSTLTNWLATDGKATETELAGETWQDLGPYLAMLLIIPMLMSFRQGLLTLMLSPSLLFATAMTFSLANSHPAQASVWQDLWKTKDQQAQSAFEQGEFSQAAETFENPQWQASAQYKASNYQQALEGFEQDSSAQGLYNQGNALMQLENYQEAINRYQQAIDLQPSFTEAQQNLEVAKKRQKQQENTDQQNESKQDQSDNGQQSDQSSDDQSNSDKSNQDSNSSPSEQSQSDEHNDEQKNEQDQQNGQANNEQQSQSGNSDDKAGDAEDKPKGTQQQANDPSQDEKGANQSPDEQAGVEPSSDDSQSQQGDQSANSDDSTMSNEASMQAESNDENESAKKQQMTTSAEQNNQPAQAESAPSNVISASQINQDDLPADMQRALRAINEDQQVLIRNKMQLEYQKRRQNSQPPKENEQW